MEAERLDDGRLVLRCALDSSPEAVRVALRNLRARVAKAPGDPPHDAPWEIVVAEVLNNIVEHAYDNRPGGEIRLELTCSAATVEAVFTDFGRAMPGHTAPEGVAADINVPRDDLPEGGFGWFLIRSLSRRLTYSHVDGANQLSLEIPFDQPG